MYSETTWAVVHWFDFLWTTPPNLSEFGPLVDSIATQFGNHFIAQANISSHVVFTRVAARLQLPDPGSALRTVRVADFAGTGTGPNESAQVAYLIDWQSEDARRGGKPRSYIPGVIDDVLSGEAMLGPLAIAAMSAHAVAYLSAVNALTSASVTQVKMIDASFVNAKDYRSTAVAYAINDGVCSNAVGTQRRRVNRVRIS